MSRVGKAAGKSGTTDTGANLGFEAKLWQAADALHNNMDAAEYKHVVLGRCAECRRGKYRRAGPLRLLEDQVCPA